MQGAHQLWFKTRSKHTSSFLASLFCVATTDNTNNAQPTKNNTNTVTATWSVNQHLGEANVLRFMSDATKPAFFVEKQT